MGSRYLVVPGEPSLTIYDDGSFEGGDPWFPLLLGRGSSSLVAIVLGGQSVELANNQNFVRFDESNGQLATAVLPPYPEVGQRVTFKWWNWESGSPPPLIEGNGNEIELYGGTGGAQGLGTSTSITQEGDAATWMFDGTYWVLVA